jgi:hypothetical protein
MQRLFLLSDHGNSAGYHVRCDAVGRHGVSPDHGLVRYRTSAIRQGCEHYPRTQAL